MLASKSKTSHSWYSSQTHLPDKGPRLSLMIANRNVFASVPAIKRSATRPLHCIPALLSAPSLRSDFNIQTRSRPSTTRVLRAWCFDFVHSSADFVHAESAGEAICVG